MGTDLWQGSRVRLRAFEPSDWETVYEWNLDSETARRLDHVWFPQSKEAARRWTEETAARRPQGDSFFFGIENLEGELVGQISTHHCDARAGTFEYGVSVRSEHRRKGYASEAILLLLRYYFFDLRYHKVTVHLHSYNAPTIFLHEKLGFKLEGRIREVVYTGGRRFDDLVYGMTAEEFKARNNTLQ